MSDAEMVEFIKHAIECWRGDDLAKKKDFAGMTDEQMEQEHGYSGRTRREVLDGYQAHWDKCDRAIEFLERA